MNRTPARTLVTALLSAALCAACGSAPARGHAASGTVGAPRQSAMLGIMLPESLLELPPLSAADRALLTERRVIDFCDGERLVSQLDEPPPYDGARVVDFARTYWSLLSSMKLHGKVRASSDSQPGAIPQEPQVVADAIREAQAQMWAYFSRAEAAVAITRMDHEPASYLHGAFDDAFVQLANSQFTRADAVLQDAYTKLCPAQ